MVVNPPEYPPLWRLLDSFETWCEGNLALLDYPTPEGTARKKRELEEIFWHFYMVRENILYRRYLFTIFFKWHFRLDHYWFFFQAPTCVLRHR